MKTPIRHSVRFAIAAAAALSVAVPATASAAVTPAETTTANTTSQPSATTKAALRKQADAINAQLNSSTKSTKSLRSAPTKSFTYTGSGRPGGLTVYRVQGTHLRPCGAWYCAWNPVVSIPGPMIYRSPATSGAQSVLVRYVVQRWDSSFGWSNLIVKDQFDSIWAGHPSTRVPQQTWYPTKAGYLRVFMIFAWASGGTSLGGRTVSMVHQGDYECATRMQTCFTGPGYVFLRSPGL